MSRHIDWRTLPDWVGYAAQDQTGWWNGYARKPYYHNGSWEGGGACYSLHKSKPLKDCSNSMRPRP